MDRFRKFDVNYSEEATLIQRHSAEVLDEMDLDSMVVCPVVIDVVEREGLLEGLSERDRKWIEAMRSLRVRDIPDENLNVVDAEDIEFRDDGGERPFGVIEFDFEIGDIEY